jgi:hypothetical protein
MDEELKKIQLKICNCRERINTKEINTIIEAIRQGYRLVKEEAETISVTEILKGTPYEAIEVKGVKLNDRNN